MASSTHNTNYVNKRVAYGRCESSLSSATKGSISSEASSVVGLARKLRKMKRRLLLEAVADAPKSDSFGTSSGSVRTVNYNIQRDAVSRVSISNILHNEDGEDDQASDSSLSSFESA